MRYLIKIWFYMSFDELFILYKGGIRHLSIFTVKPLKDNLWKYCLLFFHKIFRHKNPLFWLWEKCRSPFFFFNKGIIVVAEEIISPKLLWLYIRKHIRDYYTENRFILTFCLSYRICFRNFDELLIISLFAAFLKIIFRDNKNRQYFLSQYLFISSLKFHILSQYFPSFKKTSWFYDLKVLEYGS